MGLKVTSIKIDPYLNIDAGTLSPLDHGEVFVLNDGGEVDLDLGNYERYLDVTLTRSNNITTGKIYRDVIERERKGDYLGKTVQVVPHITDAIQDWVERVATIPVDDSGEEPDVCIIELGGTVGDIESAPFVEAMRQFQFRVGHDNFALIHVSLVPTIGSVGEQKTKPTQASIRDLRGLGLTPDLIACRCEKTGLDEGIQAKISMFCHVQPNQVLAVRDCNSVYHVPELLKDQGLVDFLWKRLNIEKTINITAPLQQKGADMWKRWNQLTAAQERLHDTVTIVLVGKYTNLQDSYASVVKALEHASLNCRKKLIMKWVEASDLESETRTANPVKYHEAWQDLCSAEGILVPGGFGNRGVEGKIAAAKWAREQKVPYLGICLGLQIAVIEFARNVCGMTDANSIELDENTTTPVVVYMPEISKTHLGGTMRLGARPTEFQAGTENSTIRKLYGGGSTVLERHRHRYEINPELIEKFEAKGLKFVGKDETGQRMEIVELADHPYFLGVQYHPEYLTRPLKPSAPFMGLILAATNELQGHLATLPAQTVTRAKRTPNQQEVLPPNNSSSAFPTSSSSPIIPLNNGRQQPQKHDQFGPVQQQQQRHQHERGGHRQSQHAGGFNPWFHHYASKRAAFRAFVAGSILTATGATIYSASTSSSSSASSFFDKISERWTQLQSDVSYARASFTSSTLSSDPTVRTFSPSFSPNPFSASRFEKQLKMLSPEQVEERLAQNQRSFRVMTKEQEKSKDKEKQDLILGYCVNQVASNNPIEDDLSRHVVRAKDGSPDKVFFGVFDGHGGWCCSQKVAQELAPSVAAELENVKDPHDVMAVMEAIENGFLKLDDKIVNETVQRVLAFPSRPLACSSLLPAISGSCALMAYVDVKEKDLYVACAGDSRAVLGVREPSATDKSGHTWKAVPLSFDQTGRNRWEVRRLQEEHPGEENTVVMRGRVLGGLEPTRAFGDARYKWSREIQERVFQLFPTYRQPHRNYYTPPYVTAKPVVKHHKIRPEDRFLVMATDGLWDKLTSDEVIQLVGDLLDGKTGQERMILDRNELKAIKSKVKAIQGIVTGKSGDQTEEEEELTPANLPPKGPASQVRQFTFKDRSNASTHLVRNALGGGNDDMLAATLSIPAPMSRYYRDDITITVIFFGEQDTKLALSGAEETDGFVEIV
ncbi:CTP synthase ura7 [Haplosporangium sp. Z 11]|nr:CTP synthase ura7 [Haplosporangium sp. Z 11]